MRKCDLVFFRYFPSLSKPLTHTVRSLSVQSAECVCADIREEERRHHAGLLCHPHTSINITAFILQGGGCVHMCACVRVTRNTEGTTKQNPITSTFGKTGKTPLSNHMPNNAVFKAKVKTEEKQTQSASLQEAKHKSPKWHKPQFPDYNLWFMPAVILPDHYCSGTSFKGHLLLQRYSTGGMWQNAIILHPRIKTCCIMTPRELLWASLHNTFVTYEESAWGARVEVCVCASVNDYVKLSSWKCVCLTVEILFPWLTCVPDQQLQCHHTHTHTQNQLCDPIHLCSHTAKSDSENLCLEELVLEKRQSWDNFMGTRGDKWGRM